LQSLSSVARKRNASSVESTDQGEAKADLFDYIEIFYNRTRRHSHLGKVSPYDFEMASSGKK